MPNRTDLAIEFENAENYTHENRKKGDVMISKINITSKKGEEKFERPQGTYITLQFPDIQKTASTEILEEELKKALSLIFPKNCERILVAGLGNAEITADSIGPLTASMLLATRHIAGKFAENLGLKGLKSISVIAPGVLGKTGIESAELIKGVSDKIKPQAVIIIDALAAGSLSRLFKTVQLSDSGIAPGSGVKNSRKEISEKTLGIPVIAIGVPTVVDAGVIAEEAGGKKADTDFEMILTPKDSDILCRKLSEIIARCLNIFLQPEIEKEIIMSLV